MDLRRDLQCVSPGLQTLSLRSGKGADEIERDILPDPAESSSSTAKLLEPVYLAEMTERPSVTTKDLVALLSGAA